MLSGNGNGTVSFTVAANPGISSRTGTLTVAGQTFTVNQSGVPCSYSLSLASQSLASAASSGTVGVTAQSGCSWSAASNASWITVTAGATGNGNGTVSYSATANPTASPRTGTVSIGGQTFTLTQAGSVTLPAAPSGLIAYASSPSQIQLAWSDNSGNEAGFTIERSLGGNSGFAVLATVATNVTSYTNTGLAESTTYIYRVRAVNAAGSSGFSNQASATTFASAPPAAE